MSLAFLDSSFVIALHSVRDQHHAAGLACWQSMRPTPTFLTTTFILDEVVSHLNRHDCHERAVEVGEQMLRSKSIKLIHVDGSLLTLAWAYFVRHQDKQYSPTDCLSFVVMEERRIRRAFTFDHHFAQAGFDMLPASSPG